MAIFGAICLTLLAAVLIYVIGCVMFLYIGFAEERPVRKTVFSAIPLALILGVCYGWFWLVGQNIHLSFG